MKFEIKRNGMQQKADILIVHGMIVTMDDERHVIRDGGMAIHAGKIVALGESAAIKKRFTSDLHIDAQGKFVVPGLINTHAHGADALFRGLVEDLALEEWLQQLQVIEKAFVNAESVYWGALLAYIEMLRGGITTTNDMFWHPESMIKAAHALGIRLITGPTFFDPDSNEKKIVDQQLVQAQKFLEEFRDDPLVVPCLQPHGVYTVSPDFLSRIGDIAKKNKCFLTIHASETATEVRNCIDRYGLTPIQHLDKLGLLSEKTILAHCIHLDDEDLKILSSREAIVSHCPLSNLKMASGIADVVKMTQAGIKVTLGTDGPVSGNDLTPWFTMRLAAILQKTLHQDPRMLPAEQVLGLMTKSAAESLNLGQQIGSLEIGKDADVLLIDCDHPHTVPSYDPYSTLIYSVGREDVDTVIVNGRVLMQGRKLLHVDEQEVIMKVKQLSSEIINFRDNHR